MGLGNNAPPVAQLGLGSAARATGKGKLVGQLQNRFSFVLVCTFIFVEKDGKHVLSIIARTLWMIEYVS